MEGELLEEIEVDNGLRQGCTMVPTLFNLYACVVTESWLCRMRDVEGVGTSCYISLTSDSSDNTPRMLAKRSLILYKYVLAISDYHKALLKKSRRLN